MKFEPTKESISTHKVPKWYDDAKLGIFIHWGLYSVPAYAPNEGANLHELAESEAGFANSMKNQPYAEWYLNTLRIDGSPTQKYHAEKYGKDFPYFSFQSMFEDASKNFNAQEWADLIAKSGAKYSIMVTKHHEGYCLWPSKFKNPFDEKYQSQRDFVGEVTDAIRAKDVKMGLYYSGIYDWTFKKYPIDGMENWVRHNMADDAYAQYATNHMYELIERYQPSILWNDIGYPASIDLNKLFADYYNSVPEGVVNDRWRQTRVADDKVKEAAAELEKELKEKGLVGILSTPEHCDYVTQEYAKLDEIQQKKWEEVRGLGLSFAYNQAETEDTMLDAKQLVHKLVDITSKNGNLCVSIGPEADGSVPEVQQRALEGLGEWMAVNEEAVCNTRPWKRPSSKTTDGKDVRYTANGDKLYATILAEGSLPGEVTIKELDVPESATVELLGSNGTLGWEKVDGGIKVSLPEDRKPQFAYALRIR